MIELLIFIITLAFGQIIFRSLNRETLFKLIGGEIGAKEMDCWTAFLESLVDRVKGQQDGAALAVRIRKQHTLGGLRELVPTLGGLVVYFKYTSRFDKENHITLTPTDGFRMRTLAEMFTDEDLSSARYHAYTAVTAFKIDAALYAKIATETPKAGRAPMDKDALHKSRVSKFDTYKLVFTFSTYPGDLQHYGKSITTKPIADTDTILAAWIVSTTGLNLWIAICMHMAVRPSWNSDRHYFRAIGCPQINGENVFFAFPSDMTHACVPDGVHPWYNVMVNSARDSNRVDGLAVMTKMFHGWGIDTLKTFIMVNKDTGADMPSYCYADFLNPFFNGHTKNIDNRTMLAISDDIDYFIMMMGKFARGAGPGVARVGLPKDQIDWQNLKFFNQAPVPKLKGTKI